MMVPHTGRVSDESRGPVRSLVNICWRGTRSIAATQLVRALSPGVCVSVAHAAKAEMAGVRAGPDGVRVKLDPAPCWLRKRSSRASNAVWS